MKPCSERVAAFFFLPFDGEPALVFRATKLMFYEKYSPDAKHGLPSQPESRRAAVCTLSSHRGFPHSRGTLFSIDNTPIPESLFRIRSASQPNGINVTRKE